MAGRYVYQDDDGEVHDLTLYLGTDEVHHPNVQRDGRVEG